MIDDFAAAWTEGYERKVRKRHYPPRPFAPPRFPIPPSQPKVGGCESHASIVELIKETQLLTSLGPTAGFKTRVVWRRTPDVLRQWGRSRPDMFLARTQKWLSLMRQHPLTRSYPDFQKEEKVRNNIALVEELLGAELEKRLKLQPNTYI